ncbi:hypothetical protein C5167_000291 [Papaver somniferum]|uniref:30S ribosomal protein S8, chloroplastic n=1 Tax=Papaver somniferum TaxID=3469 RepID=A0A4Y7KVA6_PAPSO|nr:40S ribosomal protein S15a-5-like [Papaver somniferum]RZC76108.1 hypothetical protein C5167_000291 [Papaver somniferum]
MRKGSRFLIISSSLLFSFSLRTITSIQLQSETYLPQIHSFILFSRSCKSRYQRVLGEMGRRILNQAMSKIVNAERRSRATATLQPISGLMSSFLNVMKHRGYIKDFEVQDPHRVGSITVELQGRIKECKVLMHRQDIKAKDIEEYKTRNLPTRQWGYVVISTPNGVLDHEQAIEQKVGGQVIGYFH